MRLFLLALLTATAAGAQPLPTGFVFDDFAYGSTQWQETLLGDPDTLSLGPPGSLYGPNEWVVSASGETAQHRMWYRVAWQEAGHNPPARTLTPEASGLRFEVAPGPHQGEGCPDATDPARPVNVQQIASGFTARRGTWAAHVRLGSLPSQDVADMIHAFWLIAPHSAWVRAGGEEVRVTNEVDHEWNNGFLGQDQPFLYSAVGASQGLPQGGNKAPMASTLGAPVPTGGSYSRTTPRAWTCRYTRGTEDRTLAPEACSALLQGRRAAGLPAPQGDVLATLLIHIADEGIRFGLVSDGWGGRIEMASGVLTPPTQPRLTALFSQHLMPPSAQDRTCADRATLREPRRFDVDWFLYAADPALSRDSVMRVVGALRQRRVPRLSTVRGARLERPTRPVVGYAGRWGFGAWTAPLALELEVPREMDPGETATLLALPAERHGAYRYTWTLSTRYADGRYTTFTRDDAYALPFTFPEGARTVLVRVRLEEVDGDRQTVRNETVQPVERLFMIRRR